ncbi:serine hydrolase [Cryomorphaceae bacterium 1068]|nr:serine hydrolase [Cryomorphaceae bacterium 1068]
MKFFIRIKRPSFSFLFAFLFCLKVFAQDQKVDRLYSVGEGEPGYSVAVYQGDKIILERQYGSAALEYDIHISSETVFDIGSIGKQFTAAAILLLELEGKLSLSDPVYKYIENLPRYKLGDPTIEHLLNQTSGIREVDPFLEVADIYFRDYRSQSQMVNIITKIEDLAFAPGDYFYYTNANYVLLASVIEQASGQSYTSYLEENIFDPLGMDRTFVDRNVYTKIKNRALGYTEDEGRYYKTNLYFLKYVGDGQILTTARDMFKWHQNLKHSTIGSPELWKKMYTKAILNDGTTINFGLGAEFETHNGYDAMGFDGMIRAGFVSKYLYFPVLDMAFFTAQNTFDWEFRDRFFQFVDLYVPMAESKSQPIHQFEEINLTKQELEKYEGNYLFYRHDEDRKANIVQLKNDQLFVFTLDGDRVAKLVPIGNDQFYFGEDRDAIVTFGINGDKKHYTYDELDHTIPWVFNEYEPFEHSDRELREFEGTYYNEDFQLSKKLELENGVLFYYWKNGAWREEMTSLSKDLMEIPSSPIEFIRNGNNQLSGFSIMGLVFQKM